jgi:hypothetical protein
MSQGVQSVPIFTFYPNWHLLNSIPINIWLSLSSNS